MGKIVASADITRLDFSVLLDMSIAVPTLKITNLSTVVNPASLDWAFEVYTPSGTPVHVGNFTTPDIDNVSFTIFTLSEALPMIFGQLEFSASGVYSVKVSYKDAAGLIDSLTKTASLCAPNGNQGKNNFGVADVAVETKCATGQLYVTDKTNLLFKSIAGVKVSSTLELDYPTDANGNKPAGVTVTAIPALLPVYYDGAGYEIYVAHVYDYDLGDYFLVRVRYSTTRTFSVNCSLTLQPLLCEVTKIAAVLKKTCNDDSADSRRKYQQLNLATVYILEAAVGILQPLSYNMDIPAKVQAIKDLLMIECDCTVPAGISGFGSALATDANFTVNKVCGDMLLSWTNDGNGNITLNYQDTSYVFDISGSGAFTYSQAVAGCNKTTTLAVDLTTLTSEILTTITNSQTFINIVSALMQRASQVCSGLNGYDIMNLTECDYSVEINTSASGAAVTSVIINGSTYTAPGGTLATDASAIAAWLNSINLAVFVVNYSSVTQKTTITVAGSSNVISTISVTPPGGSPSVYLFSNNCGLICNILQGIFTYLNTIGLMNIKIGNGITICSLDPYGGVVEANFEDDDDAGTLLAYMAESFCSTLNYIKTRLLSCANLKSMFATHLGTTPNPGGADIVPMFQNGACQQVPLKNFAISLFGLITSDADVKTAFCNMTPCPPVNCTELTLGDPIIGDTSVTYNWSADAAAIGYKWAIGGGPYQLIDALFKTVTGLAAGVSYTFKVYPVYPWGDGLACVVTDDFTTTDVGDPDCAAPASLVLDLTSDTTMTATWTLVPGTGVTYEYRVNGGSWINAGPALSANISGLVPGNTYNVEVVAVIGGVHCPDSIIESVELEGYHWSITSTDPGVGTDADDVILAWGNNNNSPSTELYHDPYDGGQTAPNAAAVNANVNFTIGGGTFAYVYCNGVAGSTATNTASWGGVTGNIIISFLLVGA